MAMRPFSSGPTGRARGAGVVALLLLALAVAGLLAYQAQDAARSHRAAAESALRDNAAFAGWEYGHRIKQTLDENVIGPTLWYIKNADTTVAYPARAYLLKGCEKAAYLGLGALASGFAMELESGEIVWTNPERVEPEVRAWVPDSLPAHITRAYDPAWGYAWQLRAIAGQPKLIYYTLRRAGPHRPGRAAYGYIVDARALAPLLEAQFHGASLLPRALSKGTPNHELLSARVLAVGGALLWASPGKHVPRLGTEETFGNEREGFVVQIAMRPEAAEALVIGGLPRSRLPLLLLLLTLTAGLIAAAIRQLRREYQLARLRSEFVSSVSHELRTPLAQIRMFAETLLLGRVRSDEERTRSLQIIDQESRRLSHLVENVLHFSRSERSMTRIEPQPVEIAPLIREVVEGFQPLADAREAKMRLELQEGAIVDADPKALRQVLLNLLDNAVKYGPTGQTVTVAAEVAGGVLRIRVDDEGPGIPPRDRVRAWEAFWRSERESRSGVAGTGIGLSVVREIASLHGGRARVEDAPRGGARLVVELPAGPGGATSASVPASDERRLTPAAERA